ncbi:MAG: DUF4124 domain-containing protein [Oleiphilaceae bacterium]|nr:DUF4124 domain-containing protein [Oleiphilaceae bacterium]
MTIKSLFLIAMITLAPALATSAGVYKWTDDEGVTHFGDRKPRGHNTELVNIRSGKSSPTKTTGTSSSPREKLDAIDQRRQSGQEEQKLTAQDDAQRKQKQANCETARSNLAVLDSNARIKVEENGEQRFLAPEEIQEQRDRFQEIADTNC